MQTGVLECSVWKLMTSVCEAFHAHITVVYVPGHVNLEEQEVADKTAKAAAKECGQGDEPVSPSL